VASVLREAKTLGNADRRDNDNLIIFRLDEKQKLINCLFNFFGIKIIDINQLNEWRRTDGQGFKK